MALPGPGPASPDDDPEVSRPHRPMLARAAEPALVARARSAVSSAAMIPTPSSQAPTPAPPRCPTAVAAARAIDAAEAFRDLPGLVLLESARPGRNARWTYLTADPVAVLESPAAGPDPFAVARRLVGAPRPDRRHPGGRAAVPGRARRLPRLRPRARCSSGCPRSRREDQDLPPLRLALHDWVVAWDRRTGHAWIGGRALDGDGRRLARRLDDVHARLTSPPRAGADRLRARTSRRPVPLPIRPRPRRLRGGRRPAIREHIALGDLYQANLTRRLETPFDGDPWPLYRRLRTGDPSLFSAYLDLGAGQLTGRPRALLSASPEPFLSVDCAGRRHDRPDQGHAAARARPRRRTGRSRATSCRAPRTAPRT